MSTESSNKLNYESLLVPGNISGSNRPRIRLEVNEIDRVSQKGQVENSFLLRSERENSEESQDAIRARRQQFKSLFEASLSR